MQAENRMMKALPVILGAMCAALLLASSSQSAQAAACPNEAIRAEQGPAALALPDCRAYELVSPNSIPSISSESKFEFGGGKASPDGDGLAYFSRYPAEGSPTSSEIWLSKRTAGGWTVTSVDPQMTPTPTTYAKCQPGAAFSEDLDTHVLSAGGELYAVPTTENGECSTPEDELVPGEPRGYSNLYLRRGSDPYVLVNDPDGAAPGNGTFQAGSSDLSRIVFSENAELVPGAPSGYNLFEWAEGEIRAVGVLPSGVQVPATLGAATRDWDSSSGPLIGLAPVLHAVSDDGERVFFEAGGNLYLRENAGQPPAATADCRTTSEPELACTLLLDKTFGPGASGGGVFQFASRDGSRVFFTSDHALTQNSSAQADKPDLYEVDIETRKLTDLTEAPSGTANVRGISGGSDDGSRVYFMARGVLTGLQQNAEGETAQAGEPNLYLAEEHSLTYVATLSTWEAGGGVDKFNWWEKELGENARLKTAWDPSGRYLLFSSHKSLTGFDNTPAAPEACENQPSCEELFLYDSETPSLKCVSCDPGGANPVANTRLVVGRQEFPRFSMGPAYAPRSVLSTGQVFFETVNPLVDRDLNDFQDVYEYRSGELTLISSGTAEGGSGFADASADGSNVFFVAPDALVGADRTGLPSVYDARVNGGFAEPPAPPPPCVGEDACRSGESPPPASAAGTVGFVGPGNVRPRRCKRGRVRRGNRCVKKKAHRRRHHAHHHRNRNSSSREGRNG